MSDKLDLILSSIQDVDKKVDILSEKITEVRIDNAKQDEKHLALDKHLNSVAAKLRAHIDGHWGWVGTAAGLAALASFAANLFRKP